MLLLSSSEVAIISNLCLLIFCKVFCKFCVVTIFILKIAPIVERTTLGLYGSAQSPVKIICFKAALSAVLKIVPKFPGSWTPSSAKIISPL